MEPPTQKRIAPPQVENGDQPKDLQRLLRRQMRVISPALAARLACKQVFDPPARVKEPGPHGPRGQAKDEQSWE